MRKTLKLYEAKISVELSREDWDKLDDDAMEEINNEIDEIVSQAVDRVADLDTKQNVKLNVFSD
jgi:hypothetical protein